MNSSTNVQWVTDGIRISDVKEFTYSSQRFFTRDIKVGDADHCHEVTFFAHTPEALELKIAPEHTLIERAAS